MTRTRLLAALFLPRVRGDGHRRSRNAFARLTVNGQYWGLYALVEPVSKPFLEARLGEKSGTLFDYEWIYPYDFSWRGPAAESYVPLPFQPETNETKPDVADGLVSFIQAINETPTRLRLRDGAASRRPLHPRRNRERARRGDRIVATSITSTSTSTGRTASSSSPGTDNTFAAAAPIYATSANVLTRR
jgi:hypothetical protein